VRDETSAGERHKGITKNGEVGTMPLLRGLAVLLLLGGIVYAMLSGNWGIGAITFGLGAVLLGLDRIRMAQRRSDRAIGWVLVLSGVFAMVDALIWIAIGGA
jgi:hypothetical protein